jgi:hypothetical protein
MVVILIGILKSLIIYIKDALIGKKAFGALKESRLEKNGFCSYPAVLYNSTILLRRENLRRAQKCLRVQEHKPKWLIKPR